MPVEKEIIGGETIAQSPSLETKEGHVYFTIILGINKFCVLIYYRKYDILDWQKRILAEFSDRTEAIKFWSQTIHNSLL